eukprot:8420155-Ditylum_brightwellii.AAC.1
MVSSIHLENLHFEEVNGFIADLLNSTSDKTKGLAKIVHKKTYGNIFAVIHFLRSIQDEGILWYCIGTLRWRWDEDEIQSSTNVTDNVADILKFKINKTLSIKERRVLQVASCLGGSFASSNVLLIMDTVYRMRKTTGDTCEQIGSTIWSDLRPNERPNVIKCLTICAKEGLIESDDGLHYRFAHDQILSAAFSLIPQDKKALLQFESGQALLENMSNEEIEKNIFLLVNLLNNGSRFASVDTEKLTHLITLNLKASKKAMNSSAFGPAISYLKICSDLLGDDNWHDDANLSLDIL